MARHRGDLLIPPWVLVLVLLLSATFFFGGLSLAALRDQPRPLPGRTVTVPAPTVTVSYLVEVTITPGLDGY